MVAAFNSPLFLASCWGHFVTIHLSGACILDHPDFNPRGAHDIICDPALFDLSTAAYVDAIRILDAIQELHVDGLKNSFKVIFVVGDQQTYDRMCALTIVHPERYRWCIPMNGDFHFVAHTVAAFHHLYFLPFTAWIVGKLGWEKVIKEDDDNITNFKQYDHFYLLITLSILTILSEALDAALLAAPSVLIEPSQRNKSSFYQTSAFSLQFN